MKGLFGILPGARYELKSLATDEARQNGCAYVNVKLLYGIPLRGL